MSAYVLWNVTSHTYYVAAPQGHFLAMLRARVLRVGRRA